MNKPVNFDGDPDHRLDTGIVFRIRHYWEIRKVVNGHKSAAASSHLSRTDSPDGGSDIETLVRCVLAEVCTVPVLLVLDLSGGPVQQLRGRGVDSYGRVATVVTTLACS